MTETRMDIPRRSPPEVLLIHKQAAIRFGKTFGADIPSYQKLFQKVEAGTHVHVGQKRSCAFLIQLLRKDNIFLIFHTLNTLIYYLFQALMRLCIRSGINHENSEFSNSIEVIIFPYGHKEAKGACIRAIDRVGFESESCKYRMTTQELNEIVNGTSSADMKDIAANMERSASIASSVSHSQGNSTSTTNGRQADGPVTLPAMNILNFRIVSLNENEENRRGQRRRNEGAGGLTNGDVGAPSNPATRDQQ